MVQRVVLAFVDCLYLQFSGNTLSDWGILNAKDTITDIGTANKTPKNPIILQHRSIQTKTSKGLTHKAFHIIIGTKNFSSVCCMIVYKIITAKTHRHPENIKAETAAGAAHKNGQMYGMISKSHANRANVHFWGIEIQIRSKIHKPKYDVSPIKIQRKIWLFNQLAIHEYAASILARLEDAWRSRYFKAYFISYNDTEKKTHNVITMAKSAINVKIFPNIFKACHAIIFT